MEIAVSHLWHGHLAIPRQSYRLQKKSFRILVLSQYPNSHTGSGNHGITEVAKTAKIAKMAEKSV